MLELISYLLQTRLKVERGALVVLMLELVVVAVEENIIAKKRA
jgi:hypothetical protein